MSKAVSCCGIDCTECESFNKECAGGCAGIEGKPFWLTYVEKDVCPFYQCCIIDKKLAHCGLCDEFPCSIFYEIEDPNRTKEENEQGREDMIALLKKMAQEG